VIDIYLILLLLLYY